MSYPVVTEAMLVRYRERLGKWFIVEPQYESVTLDAIRHFARGVGDPNPLWHDVAHAQGSCWGSPTAPPMFLSTVRMGGALRMGLPGIAALHAGDYWEFCRPVFVGDRIVGRLRWYDLQEKPSRHAGRAFDQWCEVVFVNQRREVVGRVMTHIKRFEKGQAQFAAEEQATPYQRYRYSSEELDAIDRCYAQATFRGRTQRLWEEVVVGEDIPPLVKGPLTLQEVIAWLAASASTTVHASHFWWQRRREHPGECVMDPDTGVPDIAEAIHWDPRIAHLWGAPDALDIGGQRATWAGHLITAWMGDDSFLTRLGLQIRRMSFIGDTTWLRGRVTDKRREGKLSVADCDIICETQRGEVISSGHATVSLPTRKRPTGVLPDQPSIADFPGMRESLQGPWNRE